MGEPLIVCSNVPAFEEWPTNFKLLFQALVIYYVRETLGDRFVCGLRHDAIQHRLLSESDLTYKKALEIPWEWNLLTNTLNRLRRQIQ